MCLLQRIGSHSRWAQSWPSKGLFFEKNVKKRACVSYKELRAIRVGPRVGHREDPRARVLELPCDLILELATPHGLTAATRPRGVSALGGKGREGWFGVRGEGRGGRGEGEARRVRVREGSESSCVGSRV